MRNLFHGLVCAGCLAGDLYYQVQHDRCPHDDWYPTNVWGFDVKFDF